MTAASLLRLTDLTRVAHDLVSSCGGRAVLGITGAPGAGKSTVAAALVDAVPGAVLVGMDGFHFANRVLDNVGHRDRKGAPDTFDAGGYVALLHRLRTNTEAVYAPYFDRALDESIGSGVAVPSDAPLIVTEGNYLLLDAPGWIEVRPLLDACWYVDLDDQTRLERLITRHVEFGREPAAAAAWARGSDENNAAIITPTASRADWIIRLQDDWRAS